VRRWRRALSGGDAIATLPTGNKPLTDNASIPDCSHVTAVASDKVWRVVAHRRAIQCTAACGRPHPHTRPVDPRKKGLQRHHTLVTSFNRLQHQAHRAIPGADVGERRRAGGRVEQGRPVSITRRGAHRSRRYAAACPRLSPVPCLEKAWLTWPDTFGSAHDCPSRLVRRREVDDYQRAHRRGQPGGSADSRRRRSRTSQHNRAAALLSPPRRRPHRYAGYAGTRALECRGRPRARVS
jgi:hypothetical protein